MFRTNIIDSIVTKLMLPACLVALLLVTGCPTPGPTDPPPGQPVDTDSDGVVDANDNCPNTPTGDTVDSNGCSASQPNTDSDGDGIENDADQCPNTPANTTVGQDGCPIVMADADGDGVADSNDNCASTPAGEQADTTGCSPSQLDTDRDGVTDDIDQCANTPPTATIDNVGCPVSAGGTDTDGDGVNDDIDQCANTVAGAVVDANGCAPSQLDSDSDGVTDDLDQCPGTLPRTTVDAVGCPITTGGGGGGGGGGAGGGGGGGGVMTNDSCATPTAISEGDFTFSNVGATTDGPDEPGQCANSGFTQVGSDIWYCYTATCTDMVVVGLCGSTNDNTGGFDTKMMVYDGCGCPSTTPVACSDDDCGVSLNGRLRFPATQGQSYMIRIGGFQDAQGANGLLTIYCENDPARGLNACGGATAGACFAANPDPGCNDPNTCSTTCLTDPFCCDRVWDTICGQEADGIINGFPACVRGAGNCLASNGTPGCDQDVCCQNVCEKDPFCCLTGWDDLCVGRVGSACGLFAECSAGVGVGDCFAANGTVGCNVEACCNAVCANDPTCCSGPWDDVCAQSAVQLRLSGQCQ